MTDLQSNRLDMYLVVKSFRYASQAIIDAVPARVVAFDKLDDNITAINTRIAGQSANTTGVAQDKTAIRTALDDVTSAILSPAKAWAISINNNTLAVEFDYPISTIQKIKDDTMQGFCDHRIALITENLGALADFGIIAANVTEWQDALDAYVAVLETPREAINSKHLHTASLRTLFSNTQILFRDQLDPLMVVFKTSDPELHAAYLQARIIIDRKGARPQPTVPADTIVLGFYVYDEQTTLPIQGALLRLLNAPDGLIHQATTDATGIASLSIAGYLPGLPALVQVEISASGYETINGDSEFSPGKSYSFEVPLFPLVVPPPPPTTP